MRRRVGAGILLLLLGLGLKYVVQPTQYPEIVEDDSYVIKKRNSKIRLPASLPQKKSSLLGKTPQGPQYVISDRVQEQGPDLEVEKATILESSPYQAMSWTPGAQRSRSMPSSENRTNSQSKTTPSSADNITSSPSYSVPQSSPSVPSQNKETKEKEPTEVVESKDSKAPICSVNLAGGSFQRPVEINLTCSTASSIKYCISENYCCDPEQGTVYTGTFHLGQASKTFCLSFAGTSIDEQLTSETKEAFYSFDPELPHLEVTHAKTHVQTTQLDTEMILRSNDFGSPHHSMGVINLKSQGPSQSNTDCSGLTTSPLTNYILQETNVSVFSPASQMNLFLSSIGLVYGENNLTAYMKSMLYSSPQYSCSHSKVILEDFYYVQTLPLDVLSGSDNGELYGGFTSLSTMSADHSVYRGPASEIGVSPTLELRSGLISIFFDK